MAFVKDKWGTTSAISIFLLTHIGLMQITSEFASKALQDKITVSEFSHSWSQNSIVSHPHAFIV